MLIEKHAAGITVVSDTFAFKGLKKGGGGGGVWIKGDCDPAGVLADGPPGKTALSQSASVPV